MNKKKTLLVLSVLLFSLTGCAVSSVRTSSSSTTSSSKTSTTPYRPGTTSKTSSSSSKTYPAQGYDEIDFSVSKVPTVHSLNTNYACPSTGDMKFLVIPIEFSDRKASSLGYTISNLKRVFSSTTDEDERYYSVGDYFNTSSYGKLNVTFDVLDKWYSPSQDSDYYISGNGSKISYYGQTEGNMGDQNVLDEILGQLEDEGMDLSQYDSNNDGYIDGVICINTLKVAYEPTINWAYQYYNYITDTRGNRNTYDGVAAFNYFWGSYAFLNEHYVTDDEGTMSASYDAEEDVDPSNTYTYIHELSHILGAEDYYDTTYDDDNDSALEGMDVMDATAADHSPFTKFEYGWVTSTRLVDTESTVTLDLQPFESTGDTIIIANDFSSSNGAFQEYYIVTYYTNTGLNYYKGENALFSRDGILVYHVDATLSGKTGMYSLKYSNDYNKYSRSQHYLLSYVKCTSGDEETFTYVEGDSLSSTLTDYGSNYSSATRKKIPYTFSVDSLTSEKATLTFTVNA